MSEKKYLACLFGAIIVATMVLFSAIIIVSDDSVADVTTYNATQNGSITVYNSESDYESGTGGVLKSIAVATAEQADNQYWVFNAGNYNVTYKSGDYNYGSYMVIKNSVAMIGAINTDGSPATTLYADYTIDTGANGTKTGNELLALMNENSVITVKNMNLMPMVYLHTKYHDEFDGYVPSGTDDKWYTPNVTITSTAKELFIENVNIVPNTLGVKDASQNKERYMMGDAGNFQTYPSIHAGTSVCSDPKVHLKNVTTNGGFGFNKVNTKLYMDNVTMNFGGENVGDQRTMKIKDTTEVQFMETNNVVINIRDVTHCRSTPLKELEEKLFSTANGPALPEGVTVNLYSDVTLEHDIVIPEGVVFNVYGTFVPGDHLKFDVTIASNNNEYGSVSDVSVVDVPYGTAVSVDGDKITINGTTITATPTPDTAQYAYTFDGWSVPNGYQITGYDEITATFTRSVQKYTVTITGEGVTVKAGNTVVENGAKVDYGTDLVATIADKTGYIKSITPENVTVTANVEFVGTYTPIAYVIAFNANGGTGEAMANIDATYDVEVALTANVFTKEGYAFGGWATAADGAAVYSDGAKVKNLTTTADATVTLYATWIKVEKTDNSAEITVTTDAVSDQAADQLVEAAKEIKAAGAENVTVDVKATETESVSIKSDSVKDAVDSGIGVNIATSKGAMEFSSEALAGLVKTGETLKSEIKQVEVPPAYVDKVPADTKVFSISLTSNDVAITSFGAKFTVRVAYAATGNTDNLYVAYLAADGTMQKMDSYYEDGYMVFTTDHLSDYAVLEDSSSANNQGLLLAVLLVAAIVAPIIVALVIYRKN